MGSAVSSSRKRPMKPTVASGSRARAPSSIPRPARRTGTRQTGPEISSTSVCASGVRICTGRVGMSRVASATMMSASSLSAWRNTGVRVRSSRRTASLCRLNGPSTMRRFFASSIQREGLGEGAHAVSQPVELAAGGAGDDLGDLAHLVRTHAAGRHGGGSKTHPARDGRLLGGVRDHVQVARDNHGLEGHFELLAGGPRRLEVDQDQVVIRPAGDEVEPTLEETVGHRPAVLDYLAGVVLELGLERLPESDGLAGDRVHKGTALQPGEDAAVDRLGELLAAEDHAPPRPAQRFVGGRRHDLAVRDGRGMHICGHEPRYVCHVGEQEGVYLVGYLAELVELYDARVGARAGQDHLRLLFKRDLAQLVVIYEAVLAHAVVDYRVGAAREVELHPVRQVPAVREVHREDLLARFEQGRVRRLVGLAARVRLHVDVLGPEELLRPVYGELFDYVHELAAAVVPLARVALGVLVGHHRALGRQHRRGGEVLAGYELDSRPLAFELPVERLLNLGIDNLGVRAQHLSTSAFRVRWRVRRLAVGKLVSPHKSDVIPPYRTCSWSINVVSNALKRFAQPRASRASFSSDRPSVAR